MSDSKKKIEEINKSLKNTRLSNEEVIKLQKELNKLLQEQIEKQQESYDLSSSMVDSLKETLGINIRRSTADSNLLKVNKNINQAILDQVKGSYEIDSIQKQITKNSKILEKSKITELSLSKSITGPQNKLAKIAKEKFELAQKHSKEVDRELAKAAEGKAIDEKTLNLKKHQAAQAAAAAENTMNLLGPLAKQLVFSQLNSQELENQNKARERDLKRAEDLQKKLGITGAILKGISKIPILGDIFDANKAVGAMEEHLIDGGTAVGALGAGFKNIGSQIKTGVLNPANLLLGAITSLVNALRSVDKGTGDLAKGLNMSYEEANDVRQELDFISTLSLDAAVNTKGLQEALMAVNQEMGTSGMISEETLVTMTKLNKQAGVSFKTQTALFKIGAATGKEFKDTFETFQATAKIESYRLGVAVNTKQLMADMAKISNAAKLSIEGGVEGLAKQMVTVKALGMEFSQLEGIADSLLNFESSIAAELEAELLTGKDLNLEKARQLALDNDLAGMAKEISSQIGSAKDFTNMNRIAQEAFAKSVGMSRDQLAGVLIEQEALAAIGGELSDKEKEAYEAAKQKHGAEKAAQMLKDGQLDSMVKQQDIQERFNQAVEKLQEIFVSIAGPILEIVSPFADLASNVLPLLNIALLPFIEGIKVVSSVIEYVMNSVKSLIGYFTGANEELTVMQGVVGTIASIYLAIKGYALATKTIQGVTLGIEAAREGFAGKRALLESKGLTKVVGRAIFGAISSLSTIPVVGVALGLTAAAGIASMAYKYLKADDMVSPGKGKGGYGDRTLLGPEGAIQLNNKDTVIAGTNLFADDMMSAPKGKIQVANSTTQPKEPKPTGNGDVVAGISQLNKNLEGAFTFNQVSGIAIQ